MVDWNKKFKPEYDYARTWLGRPENFDKDWQDLIRSLYELMATSGFDGAKASALSDLRYRIRKGKKPGSNAGIADMYLQAVGAAEKPVNATTDPKVRMRLAALKMLNHVYSMKTSGNKQLWIHALPKDFTDWASDHMHAKASTVDKLRALLVCDNEQFSAEQKKFLTTATHEGLAWCQRTTILLAAAKANGKGRNDARAVVKRWFADPSTTEAELDGYIDTLLKGFKAITARLNKGKFILTDWVPLRGATDAADVRWRNSEAFTFASDGEGLDVVYIESSFFVDHPGNVLKGQKNWTRILVHELTHLVCGTKDVDKGGARYAWRGIGPHAGFTGADAATNADSWAFFSADCAGMLTDAERTTALKIV